MVEQDPGCAGATGDDGAIVCDGAAVTLTFSGLLTQAVKKKASPRWIPFTAIDRVELVEPKRLSPGYLRLHLAGAPVHSGFKPELDINTLIATRGRRFDNLALVAQVIAARIDGLERVPEPSLLPPSPAFGPSANTAAAPTAASEQEELRADIARAASRLSWTLGSKREIRHLESHLWEGETVEMLAAGMYGKGNGLLALTDQRLIFLLHGWIHQQLEDFPISRISSVQWSAGLALGTLTVYASGNRAEITQIQKPDGKAMADRLRSRISGQTLSASTPTAPAAPPAASPAASPAESGTGMLEQLQQLAALKETGALTDDEFAAAKKKVLGA